MKRTLTLLLFFTLFSCISGLNPLLGQRLNAEKITEGLLMDMEAKPDAYHRAYALLADRVDPREMEAGFRLRKAPMNERVYELLTALQAKAEATQPAMLDKMQAQSGIRKESLAPFWITNIIYFEGTADAIAALSRDPAVEELGLNAKVEFERVAEEEICLEPTISGNREPGLGFIGAPEMWAMGYTGYGRRALIVDTGQDPEHPALRTQFLYHQRDIAEVWRGNTNPEDCGNHGSHVTGTVLGIDRMAEDTIGVAFNAHWMGGIGLGGSCDASTDAAGITDMLQWAVNPDGDPATIDDMPDVINNSWRSLSNSCGNASVVSIFDALYAAGVAVVFSAGNDGPGPETITNPKFNNWDTVRLFAVGNINATLPTLPIANSSSRGPSKCGGEGSLLIKPEVSAPGTRVRSSVPGGGYTNLTGTSMAAPHVAGAVLLLKEAFPYLTGEELMLALYYSCTDLGAPGEDNTYGMGMINVPAAFDYLVSQGNEPEPPVVSSSDVILMQVNVPEQNCNLEVYPKALVYNNGAEPITSLQFRYSIEGEEGLYQQEYQWEGLIAPGAAEQVTLEPLQAEPGAFELNVEVITVNGEADLRHLNNRIKRQVRIVADENLPARVVGEAPACQGGNALVQSLYEGPADISWYDADEGGELLGEGRSLLVPMEAGPRTVYAQVSPTAKVGKPSKEDGIVQSGNATFGLRFDAFSTFTLRSIKVYASEPGGRLLKLKKPDGGSATIVASVSQVGENVISVNQEIEPGEGYELELQAGKPLEFNIGGVDYPYEVPGILSITSSTSGPAIYYYFYDWEISYDYICGRTPLYIDVAEGSAVPLANFVTSAEEINLAEEPGDVTFIDESEGAVSWFWDFGDGNTSTEQNPQHTYTDTGSFEVILTVVGEDGCSNSTLGRIVIIEDAVLTDGEATARFENRLTAYPNPAQERLYLAFELEQPGTARYYLADLLGRPVLRGQQPVAGKQTLELPLSGLPPGAYLLVVDVDGERMVRRVVKSR